MSALVVSHIFCESLKVHITCEYIDFRLEADICPAIASGVALVENSVFCIIIIIMILLYSPFDQSLTLCYNNSTFFLKSHPKIYVYLNPYLGTAPTLEYLVCMTLLHYIIIIKISFEK